MLWRSGTAKFQVAHGLTMPLNQLVPQISRMMQTMIHGVSAAQTWASVGLVVGAGSGGGTVDAELSWVRSAGDNHRFAGFHTCRKPIRQAMEISEAPMSTIQGLMKLEIT